jgi:hypothetical protein
MFVVELSDFSSALDALSKFFRKVFRLSSASRLIIFDTPMFYLSLGFEAFFFRE